jgi:acyl carrier protein
MKNTAQHGDINGIGGIRRAHSTEFQQAVEFIHGFGLGQGIEEPASGWNDDASLTDAGYDSDIGLALITAMENEWDLEFDPDQVDQLTTMTVNQLAGLATTARTENTVRAGGAR